MHAPPHHADPDPWTERAACRDTDPETFFPLPGASGGLDREAIAKRLCGRCPVARECLREALVRDESAGIWGGFNSRERRELLRIAGTLESTGAELAAYLAEGGRRLTATPRERPAYVWYLRRHGWTPRRIAGALGISFGQVQQAWQLAELASSCTDGPVSGMPNPRAPRKRVRRPGGTERPATERAVERPPLPGYVPGGRGVPAPVPQLPSAAGHPAGPVPGYRARTAGVGAEGRRASGPPGVRVPLSPGARQVPGPARAPRPSAAGQVPGPARAPLAPAGRRLPNPAPAPLSPAARRRPEPARAPLPPAGRQLPDPARAPLSPTARRRPDPARAPLPPAGRQLPDPARAPLSPTARQLSGPAQAPLSPAARQIPGPARAPLPPGGTRAPGAAPRPGAGRGTGGGPLAAGGPGAPRPASGRTRVPLNPDPQGLPGDRRSRAALPPRSPEAPVTPDSPRLPGNGALPSRDSAPFVADRVRVPVVLKARRLPQGPRVTLTSGSARTFVAPGSPRVTITIRPVPGGGAA
ncbi:WhiB family transcriptional regulator [Streptomyces sp. G1]|nr:WhiB family transcriptional regulator [Streptomyces sp. G1]